MTVTLDDPRQSSSLPKPVDDEVALLLQTVWDLLSGGDHWPPYRTVDRLLYRERRMSVDEVIARTPTVLLLGGRPEGGASPRPDGQLSLTVAGAAASAGSELALAVFLATVRLAAEAELQPVPNGEDPTVTFDDAAAAANGALAPEVAARVARQSGLLLHPEPWTGHVLLYQSGWRVTVDRRVRPYAGVADLETYWRVREQQRGASTAQEEPPTPGATATTGSGGLVIELARRWKIGERLGSGGFGTVYRAAGEDGTQAAAKLVPKVPGADREMLFAELGGVRNVVPIIDSGETEEAWVLVMPLAERSLQDHLAASGPLPVAEALVVTRDVAAALADLAARAARVVHRDIKPANVLLLDGAWCLADFGISRYAEASTAPDTHKYSMSPPYAAPERWRAERATAAADVYAVGVMAHELLSGRRPFPGPGVEDYREQHLHAEPPRLEGAPPQLAALIEECLYKPPQARPSPANLALRLERASGAGQSPGAAALAAAYQREAGRAAGRGIAVSQARTEEQRRAELAESAKRSLDGISNHLLDVIVNAVPAKVQHRPDMKWTVELGSARFELSGAIPFDGRAWGGWEHPPFDVVAFATISIAIPADRYGYEGRSHSLYFCDAREQGSYGWYETAFMISPLMGERGRQNPFALDPGEPAAKALWPGLAEYQVAWPFTELVVGDLDEFVDRWVGWFAAAVEGRLAHPSQMPERNATGTWRRQ